MEMNNTGTLDKYMPRIGVSFIIYTMRRSSLNI